MEVAVERKRKLIDLEVPVFDALTVQARGRGMSLKNYIETLLKEESAKRAPSIPKTVTSPRIIGIVGIAKRSVANLDPSDDRAWYILSK